MIGDDVQALVLLPVGIAVMFALPFVMAWLEGSLSDSSHAERALRPAAPAPAASPSTGTSERDDVPVVAPAPAEPAATPAA